MKLRATSMSGDNLNVVKKKGKNLLLSTVGFRNKNCWTFGVYNIGEDTCQYVGGKRLNRKNELWLGVVYRIGRNTVDRLI